MDILIGSSNTGYQFIHLLDLPNMIKERISNREGCEHCCSFKKKWQTKAIVDWNEINMEELLVLQFLIRQ